MKQCTRNNRRCSTRLVAENVSKDLLGEFIVLRAYAVELFFVTSQPIQNRSIDIGFNVTDKCKCRQVKKEKATSRQQLKKFNLEKFAHWVLIKMAIEVVLPSWIVTIFCKLCLNISFNIIRVLFPKEIFELNEINLPKCTELDYINFLFAFSRILSCIETCSWIFETHQLSNNSFIQHLWGSLQMLGLYGKK